MAWIVVTGYMGAGKSTVGRALAARLDRVFIDSDERIEADAGIDIPKIFATKGELWFRRNEERTIREIVQSAPDGVLAVGGGALESRRTQDLLGRVACVACCGWTRSSLWERVTDERRCHGPRSLPASVRAARAGIRPGRRSDHRRRPAHRRGDRRTRGRRAGPPGVPHAGGLVTTGRPAVPRHLVWGEVGAAHFPVCIGPGEIGSLGALWTERAIGDSALVIFDGSVAGHAQAVEDRLRAAGVRVVAVAVPPGEPSKSLQELERICRTAAQHGIRRSDAVVAVGGGVVGDLAGFVAASYQRGINLVHVPTTLLAMVDSSIGGKTGVDLPEAKNYVGAIWQPELVVMDTDVLASLPARELACGFAEVVKYGLLDSYELFTRVEGWPAPCRVRPRPWSI